MRPLDKGISPTDAFGNAIMPTDYKNWRLALVKRIGYYCVYCNQPLSHSLQVEHVIPKNPLAGFTPGDPISWDNMLLACGPCNNAKSNTPIDSNTYYLPEEHNTHLPFTIEVAAIPEHAIVTAKNGINPIQVQKADLTIDLLELAAIDLRNNVVDIRSQKRKDAMIAVSSNRQLFDLARQAPAFNVVQVAQLIKTQAVVTGFFSLWYDAFTDVPEVLQALITINGTDPNCFDAANGYRPIPRNPTNLTDTI